MRDRQGGSTLQRRADTTEALGWAVVTGASSGLGREFALTLGERGYPVLAVARRGDRLRALEDEVERRGGRLEPLVADLATPAGLETLLSTAGGRDIDLLVNNAGLARYGPFLSISSEQQRELVRLNVEAIVTLTRELVPTMAVRRRGGVINIASQMAFQPMPYFAAYAASKAFVLSFSEALAAELRNTGVRVSVLAPGFVNTEFAEVAGSRSVERRLPHLEAQHVVRLALDAHERGRTVKVGGRFYAFLTLAGRFAPRALLLRMMERAFRPAEARADS
jgi:short-subunit dehydrogenase